MQDLVTRRYIELVLSIVDEHLAEELPDYTPGDLERDPVLMAKILSQLHDTASAEVQ